MLRCVHSLRALLLSRHCRPSTLELPAQHPDNREHPHHRRPVNTAYCSSSSCAHPLGPFTRHHIIIHSPNHPTSSCMCITTTTLCLFFPSVFRSFFFPRRVRTIVNEAEQQDNCSSPRLQQHAQRGPRILTAPGINTGMPRIAGPLKFTLLFDPSSIDIARQGPKFKKKSKLIDKLQICVVAMHMVERFGARGKKS